MDDLKWVPKKRHEGEEFPSSFILQSMLVKITVHGHIDHPDTWFLTCQDVGIYRRKLVSDLPFNARREAFKIVQDKLKAMLESIT